MNKFDAFLLLLTLVLGGGTYIILAQVLPWQTILGISLVALGIGSAIMYAVSRWSQE